MALLNDHINMVTRNGRKKAVPIWQIKQWVEAGRFSPLIAKGNDIGYDFEDQKSGIADMQAFETAEARKRMARMQSSLTPKAADAGIADPQFRQASNTDPAFTSPPMPEVGQEKIGKDIPKPRPKDVI